MSTKSTTEEDLNEAIRTTLAISTDYIKRGKLTAKNRDELRSMILALREIKANKPYLATKPNADQVFEMAIMLQTKYRRIR